MAVGSLCILGCVWTACLAVSPLLLSLPVLSCLFHALRTPRLIASCSVCVGTQLGLVPPPSPPSSAPYPQPCVSAGSPLCAQVAIIADLTPNSQLASTRCSVLIIYQLPQHLQLALDRWAPALFLLSPALKKKKERKIQCGPQPISFVESWGLNSSTMHCYWSLDVFDSRFWSTLIWLFIFLSYICVTVENATGC